MKKTVSLYLWLVLILVLSGCGNTTGSVGKLGNQPAGVNDVLEAGSVIFFLIFLYAVKLGSKSGTAA